MRNNMMCVAAMGLSRLMMCMASGQMELMLNHWHKQAVQSLGEVCVLQHKSNTSLCPQRRYTIENKLNIPLYSKALCFCYDF